MTDIAQKTLAGIVMDDHRAATVLERYHLDFCCKGKRTLADACEEKNIPLSTIVAELGSIHRSGNTAQIHFQKMTADQLIDYIVSYHHGYVKQMMPQIYDHLERVAVKYGDRFPKMIEVFRLFAVIRNEMTMHMQKEELMLFPAIKKAERSFPVKDGLHVEAQIIRGAVQQMEKEHDSAGEDMLAIQLLTNNYEAPEGACNTHQLSLAELKAFQEDLHRHVHLENNVLFPKATRLVE
jgi:regulator of cell morphogenesis and NO signaling